MWKKKDWRIHTWYLCVSYVCMPRCGFPDWAATFCWRVICVYVLTYLHAWHGSLLRHVADFAMRLRRYVGGKYVCVFMWLDSCMWVTLHTMCLCDMCVYTRLMHMCDVTHSYMFALWLVKRIWYISDEHINHESWIRRTWVMLHRTWFIFVFYRCNNLFVNVAYFI